MGYLNFKSLYDKNPLTNIHYCSSSVFEGEQEIIKKLKAITCGVLCFETYPGVDLEVLLNSIIRPLNPFKVINIENHSKNEKEIDQMLARNLTDDRVFGLFSHHVIADFYPKEKIEALKKEITTDGLVVIYGFGASLLPFDQLIQVGITRWEMQQRFRRGATNFKKNNGDEDILKKYKRGYFVEWRVADRIKDDIVDRLDYVMDYNDLCKPMMLGKEAYHVALDQLTQKPFRMVPYFDPGVWGGQWMKEVCHLDPREKNFAWSFDGVPEENSLKLKFGDKIVELPAQDLVQFRPRQLMGDKVHGRFGKNFPIRFDMLDTMEGGHLSLQVHPLTEYIQDTFGMTYTQDESYYILDAKKDGVVYLGFLENIDVDNFEHDLRAAEQGNIDFEAETYVNRFAAKKHDHFLIPAGTIHCSGKNTMVLEISACVYIFTFKLWDWGRLGLDGKPRPVHLDHGFKSLQYDRDTTWVKDQLINHVKRIDAHEELTGLHEREFLETRRYTFSQPLEIKLDSSIHVANLVEGRAAIIESLDGTFEPFEVHYAETFILPAGIKQFSIRSLFENETCMIIKAHVR